MARLNRKSALLVCTVLVIPYLFTWFYHTPVTDTAQIGALQPPWGRELNVSVLPRSQVSQNQTFAESKYIADAVRLQDLNASTLRLERLQGRIQNITSNLSCNHTLLYNFTQSPINISGIFYLMPHLQNNLSNLIPAKRFGRVKRGVQLVMAVPHVHRLEHDYLIPTLQSLFKYMTPSDRESTVIIIMVAEPWNDTVFFDVVARISETFEEEIKANMIEVILPPTSWYPDLDPIPLKWGDSEDRTRWRIKQNLDYAFLMLQCSQVASLYLQLEDDITAKSQYVQTMISFASSVEGWELLEFSQLGFIGKMFHTARLLRFVEFILMFYTQKPTDILLNDYFAVAECMDGKCPDIDKIRKRYKPSLFQHEGYHSSLAGKIQKIKDGDYEQNKNDPEIHQHTNPPAKLETTLRQYQEYSLAMAYSGQTAFWALNPQSNDHITFTFHKPVRLKQFKVVSGDLQHKDDRFQNASISFKPSGSDDFILQQFFTTASSGDGAAVYSSAQGTLPGNIGPIEVIKILSHSESQSWLIINEIWFDEDTASSPSPVS